MCHHTSSSNGEQTLFISSEAPPTKHEATLFCGGCLHVFPTYSVYNIQPPPASSSQLGIRKLSGTFALLAVLSPVGPRTLAVWISGEFIISCE